VDDNNEQLDDMQAERENNLAEKSGKEAFKRQAKKHNRNQTIKKIWQKIPIAVKLMLLKILVVIIIVLLVVSMIVAVIDEIDSMNKQQSLYEQSLQNTAMTTTLEEYLKQFSHAGEAPQSEDGKFYKMYSDRESAETGWPTIGNADILWRVWQDKFAVPGQVMTGEGQIKTVANVQEYVNGYLTRGSEANYGKAEVDSMNIYIEKSVVDNVGKEIRETYYNKVKEETEGLNLSQQQLYALTAIAYATGNIELGSNYSGKHFKEVYQEGLANYAINSWEHNRYIWDNWWCYKASGSTGTKRSRDAQFETYVKGIYNFAESPAGEVSARKYFIYWTESQLALYDDSPELQVTRTPANEPEIFTYVENVGNSGTILQTCEQVMNELLTANAKYGYGSTSNGIEASSNFGVTKECNCAIYVSAVLYKSGLLSAEYINNYNYNTTGYYSNPYGGNYLNQMMYDAPGWIQVSEEDVQPGDVCIYLKNENGNEMGHSFIYAGDGYAWDQTSGCISSSGNAPVRGKVSSWETWKNKYTVYVWHKM